MSLASLVNAAELIRADVVMRHAWLGDLRLAGIGWATVELDRAARELGGAISTGAWTPVWAPAERDDHLGASARRSTPAALGDPMVLILEPDTEGRLAAALARFGEGVAAIYLARNPTQPERPPAGEVSGPVDGPLGHGRILLGAPAWGPHVILLEAVQ